MLKIGTHNGTFHCDEALACFLLKQLPTYKESEIIRTRDPSILSKCDIVVDVGSVFDPKQKKFDHHQKTFNETFKTLVPEKPWDIKLSSAGLIYVYFGKEILTEICKRYDTKIDINILFDKMYEHFVLEIDAIDNGISVCDGVPRYATSSTLSSRVSHINPRWNEKSVDENACFEKAMKLVGSEFIDRVEYYVNCWWSARELVQKAIDDRYNVHESGLILKFENGGFPWKSHFFDLEKNMLESCSDSRSIKKTIERGEESRSKKNMKDSGEDDQSKQNLKESADDDQSKQNLKESGDDQSKKIMKESDGAVTLSPYQIRFVLFSDGKMWRVQCIPLSEKQGFINRLGLLEEWRGIREEELCTLSCIPDSVFVHANGFIGGNKSYDGALKMAVKTLEHAGLV